MNEEQNPKSNLQSEIDNAISGTETKTVVDQNVSPTKPMVSPADSYEIASVRTYKGDVSDTVKGNKIDSSKILIAEQKLKDREGAKEDTYSIENNTNKFKLTVSVILIGLAIVAIIYVSINFLNPVTTNVQRPVFEQSDLFVAEKTELLDITGKTNGDIKTEVEKLINDETLPENSIAQLVFYQNDTENSKKVQKKLSANSVLNLLNLNPPDVFRRSLSNSFMVGVYRINSQNNKFLLFKLADFPNTYDSIFGYEKDIVSDMRWFMGGFDEFAKLDELRKKKIELLPKDNFGIVASSTVGTSTPQDTPTQAESIASIDQEITDTEAVVSAYRIFIDMVLQNTDSRAVIGQDGSVAFYYTFIDRQWLIFAENIEVLKEVKRRLREKNLVQ